MNFKRVAALALLVCIAGVLLGAGTAAAQNSAPTADADGPYSVNEGGSVILDGSGSFDPDGDSLTYQWDLNGDGSIDVTGATPTFDASGIDGTTDVPVSLTVTDPDGASDTDSTTVTVSNVAPSVSADDSTVTVDEGQTATNTGTYSDPVDSVTVTANPGTITDDSGGTWSWEYTTSSGDDGTTVSVTADDGEDTTTTTFDLNVNNVAPPPDINSCMTLDAPGEYQLTTDLTDRTERSCINITSSDVIFDGQGHTIDGVNGFNTLGINVTSSSTLTNVTVRNVTVTDWNDGILYDDADNGKITDVNVTDNDDEGIRLNDLNNSDVTSNSVTGNRDGIDLRSSSGNNVTSNNVRGNTQRGIFLGTSSNNNNVASNNASGNSLNGISLSSSSGNNVTNNNATSSVLRDGIQLSSSDNNTVASNNASGNGDNGIELVSSSGNNVTSNDVTGNGGDGINLGGTFSSSGSDNNAVTNNTAIGNGLRGIHLSGSLSNDVTENYVSSNVRDGILLTGSNNNSLTDNNATSNGNGIQLDLSSDNHLSANNASGNSRNGIFLSQSSGNALSNNTALNNGDWEFESEIGSSDNTVRNLDIGTSTNPETTLTFEESKDIALKSVDSPPSDPSGASNISRFVNITDNSPDSFVNLTVNYNDSDASGVDESRLRIWRNDGSWSVVSGVNGVDKAENEVFANINSFSVFAPLSTDPDVSTCRDIPAPGKYRLTTDLTDRPEQSCINVTSSDVVFDGQGHTVDGLDNSETIGVNVTASSTLTNVTVRNVTVTDWDRGIRYDDANDGKITYNDVSSNVGEGIRVVSSDGNRVKDNNASSNLEGIELDSSSDNLVTNNMAKNNADWDFFSDSGDAKVNETYGGTNVDRARSVVQTSDGGFALGGWTASFGGGWLIKTDANGNVEINETFESGPVHSVVQTDDGGFALASETGNDALLIKTDANGNVEFTQTVGGADNDDLRSVVQTDDGGFALAGQTRSFSSGGDFDYDAWLIKTDSNGNVEINETFGGTELDFVSSVVQTDDGGLALGGNTETFGSGDRDGWLIKTDANGNKEFDETFGGANSDITVSVVQTSDGGYALGGDTRSFGPGGRSGWLVKTDANGNEQFNETFGGSDFDRAVSVVQTDDGGYALGGNARSFGPGFRAAWLVKTDANGNVEINETYGGADSDEAFSLVQTQDGNFALAGQTQSFGSESLDAWLLVTSVTSGAGGNNTVRNLDIGTSTNPETTLTFEESKDIALKSVDNPPNSPSGTNNISRYVNVTDNSADSFVNLTVNYDDSDVPSDMIEGSLSIWRNDGSWSEVSGSTIDTTNNEVSANITSFSIFATLGASPEVTTCRDLTAPGAYKLTTDLSDRPEQSCINITSSDVVFDGQGHTVDGVDDSGTIGINVTDSSTLTNVTVRNVTVTDWDRGIRYDNVDNGNITNNDANSNGDGIAISGSSNNLTGNNASGNGKNGINLRSDRFTSNINNNLTGNNASGNSRDGIAVSGSSNNVTGNDVSGNGENGIDLRSNLFTSSIDNNVTGNNASGNSLDGISVTGSDDNDVVNNDANSNGENGIDLRSGRFTSRKNNIAGNNASGNGFNGISLVSSSSNTVTNNNASANSRDGIRLESSSDNNNVMSNNASSNSRDGIRVESSDFNTFTDNTARNNSDWDFKSIFESVDNTIQDLEIGASTNPDMTLTFEESKDISLRSVVSPPPDPKAEGEKNIGRYVNITDNSLDSFVNLTVNYDDSDTTGVLEGSLDMWRYDGSWSELNSVVDTTNNEVSRNITSGFSVFAPLGNSRVDSCVDITSPGAYELTSDLTDRTEMSCVNITSSDVVFDGQGHTVDGVDTPGSEGINVTSSSTLTKVTVRNVTVTDWGRGIEYDNVDDGNVTDNNVTSNRDGIQLDSSNGNEVLDNNVTSNSFRGIRLDRSSDNNNITNNNATSNGDDGIRISFNSHNNEIIGNNASSNDDGIVLTDSSNNNVTGNNASGNEQNGVFFLQSNNNTVTDNEAMSNGFPGIVLDSSIKNNLAGNNASMNGFSGFFLESTSGNSLMNNTARNNEEWEFYSRQDAVDNTVRNLDIGMSTNPETTLTFGKSKDIALTSVDSPPSDPSGTSNIGRYVDITDNSADSFVNLTVNYDDSDVPSGVDEPSLSIWRNDGSWSELSGSTLDTTSNEVSANITSFSIFAPLGARTEVSSCRDLTAPGKYKLTTNLTDRPEKSCINVTSSDVIFDGQGHTVDGLDDTGTIGVNVTSSSTLTNITIRNITVTDWDTGVRYSDINDGNVTDSNVTSNVGNGVDITSSSGIDVKSNNASENDLNGIFLDSSSDNNVTDNQASSNGRDGILLRQSNSNNHVKDNNATKNNNNGIRLRFSDNNTISTNNASGNGDGIHLVSSSDNEVTDNDANSNNLGIVLVSSNGNSVSMNDASGNNGEGIRLVSSDNNEVETTNVSENDQYGIRLFSSSDNILTNNTARNNGDRDFESRGDSVNNTVKDLDIGTSTNPETTLSFGDSKDIALKSVDTPPSDPAGEKNISRFVEITNNSADSFVDLTVNYNDSDVSSGITEDSLDIWRNNDTGTWSELSGSTVDTTSNEVSANVTSFSIFAPLGNNRAGSCVDINSPGSYELTTDLTDRTEQSCVNITSSDVVFDGQGHTVDGLDDPASVGVNVTSSSALTNVTVKNLTVTDWGDGVRLDDVEDSNVTDNEANSNRDGIELRQSNSNNVSASNANGNVENGIHLVSSDNNKVTDNNATSSMMGDGILLESSGDNTVSSNNASSNTEDGINVSSASSTNRILDNDVTDNSGTGIDVTSSVANEIERNVVGNNELAGIRLIDSGASLLADNVVTDNNAAGDGTLAGILVVDSNGNFLSNNTAENNGVSEYRSESIAGNNTVEDLDIGMSTNPDTTLTFESRNVELSSTDSTPADPANEQNIGRYVNATNTSTTAYLDVTFQYTDTDVSNIAEPTLDVWKYNGTWTELASNLDTGANTVSTDVTNFSVFAPLGKQTGGGPPDGVPGIGDECRRNRGRDTAECARDRNRGRGDGRFRDPRRNSGR